MWSKSLAASQSILPSSSGTTGRLSSFVSKLQVKLKPKQCGPEPLFSCGFRSQISGQRQMRRRLPYQSEWLQYRQTPELGPKDLSANSVRKARGDVGANYSVASTQRRTWCRVFGQSWPR